MKRDHNDFCAAIDARKKVLTEKKKKRQRLLFSCAPLALCGAILIGVGLNRKQILPEDEPLENQTEGAVIKDEAKELLQAFIENPTGTVSVVLPGEEITLSDPAHVSALLTLVAENSDAFLLSYLPPSPTEDGIEGSVEDGVLNDFETVNAPETDAAADGNNSTECEPETEAETETAIFDAAETVFETDTQTETATFERVEGLPGETDQWDAGTEGEYTLTESNTDIQNSTGSDQAVYRICAKSADGKTLMIFLNADQYEAVSARLHELLNDMKGVN